MASDSSRQAARRRDRSPEHAAALSALLVVARRGEREAAEMLNAQKPATLSQVEAVYPTVDELGGRLLRAEGLYRAPEVISDRISTLEQRLENATHEASTMTALRVACGMKEGEHLAEVRAEYSELMDEVAALKLSSSAEAAARRDLDGMEGEEWEAWKAEARGSDDFALFRGVIADGYGSDRDSDDEENIDNLAFQRMSTFCEACDSHYLPNRGHVDWFKTKMNIEGSDIYSACRECRMILERSGIELPNVFRTA